jgi:hypothetical protein
MLENTYWDYSEIFSGLNKKSKQFIFENGVWFPLTDEIVEVDPDISKDTSATLYATDLRYNNIIAIVVDRGEFLMAGIHAVVLNPIKGEQPFLLKEYPTLKEVPVREEEQIVIDDVMFLCLVDNKDEVIHEWSEIEIDDYFDQH